MNGVTLGGFGCNMASGKVLIGTAGWSLPREEQPRFPGEGSHLERYARVLHAVEINSTFHRPHRRSTFERWAASVPRGFRFSVKLPRAITHELRLAKAGAALDAFLDDLAPIRAQTGCLLVQLPPSLEFEPRTASAFFRALRARFDAGIAAEPRHATWFTPSAEGLLVRSQVARVAADPARVTGGDEPGGWNGLAYFRLHGSPRVYYSSYDEDFLANLSRRVNAAPKPCWVVFDNPPVGAGTGNAIRLAEMLPNSKRPATGWPGASIQLADYLPSRSESPGVARSTVSERRCQESFTACFASSQARRDLPFARCQSRPSSLSTSSNLRPW
jgi:uncharacterized protein YecE (DUF72 family)